MSEQDDGGPAFPQVEYKQGIPYMTIPGLSMRDYFAAKALQGLLANRSDGTVPDSIDGIVSFSWRYADSMLKARDLGREK